MSDAEKVDLLTLQVSYEKGALETATRLDVTEPFGTIKEVWVDGVKFVRGQKTAEALHFTVTETVGGNYHIEGSERWWACSSSRDVTVAGPAAKALREYMANQEGKTCN